MPSKEQQQNHGPALEAKGGQEWEIFSEDGGLWRKGLGTEFGRFLWPL